MSAGSTRRTWMLLGILGLGNLLVWGERLVTATVPVGFDFATFEQEVRDIWGQSQLESRPFVPDEVIPETHIHLRTQDPGDRLYSVYLGQYPSLGILEPEPHDPQVCYQAAGYKLLKAESVFLESGSKRYGVNRVEVSRTEQDGKKLEFTTYYWHQLAGRMPVAQIGMPGPWIQAQIRYAEGRSDLVWVRVELRGHGRLLDSDLREQLLALMRSAASAMGR